MMDKIFENTQINTEKLISQFNRLNEIMSESINKAVQLNTDTIQQYAQLGVNQINDAWGITDFESMQNYLGRQAELMNEVSTRVTNDIQAYLALGESVSDDLQNVIRESISSISG